MSIVNFDTLTFPEKLERWKQAYRVLRDLPPHEREEHWDMGFFGRKTPCGTVACAAGHCGMDPWFRERGLSLDFEQNAATGAWFTRFDLHDEVLQFFGGGTYDIFYNGAPRTVEQVMVEIARQITRLQEIEAADGEWTKEDVASVPLDDFEPATVEI